MEKIIHVDELGKVLQKWLDENLIGELNFRLCLIYGFDGLERGKPMIGSELDENGDFGRAIENYQMLKNQLENKKDFDPVKFFPRIPKELKHLMPEESWPLTNLANPLALAPFFLGAWSQSKKTCLIKKSKLIPLLNPEDGNYLEHLPYSCFLLKLEDGMNFHIEAGDLSHDLISKNIIVFRSSNKLLQAMIIPEGFGETILDESDQRKYSDYVRAIHGLTKGSKQAYLVAQKIMDFFKARLIKQEKIEKKSLFVVSINPTLGAILYETDPGVIKKCDAEDLTNYDIENMPQAKMLCLLNGLGKLFTDLNPQEHGFQTQNLAELSSVAKTDSSKINNVDLSWNQLHHGQVTKVGLEKTETSVRIKCITGGEKCPHLRRKHPRNYRDDNGNIIKTVWINQVTIRADKLNKESLRGSSIELEE